MRVDILVTGRTEARGLPTALGHLFPGHSFACVLERPLDDEPYAGFTTSRLPPPLSRAIPAVGKIVQAAAAQLVPGRGGDPPDFLFVLDDLELENVDQPLVVTSTFAEAVKAHLQTLPSGLAARCEEAFRERASLHLVNPMIEAWFFPDPGALGAAGVPAGAASVSARDPEDFETTDTAYLQATEDACPCWVARGRKKQLRPKWLGQLPRHRHPKGYLQWLCRDGEARDCTTYDETTRGGVALENLDWAQLLARPDGEVQFLRALVADLADALLQEAVTGPVTQTQAPATSRFTQRRVRTLRNL